MSNVGTRSLCSLYHHTSNVGTRSLCSLYHHTCKPPNGYVIIRMDHQTVDPQYGPSILPNRPSCHRQLTPQFLRKPTHILLNGTGNVTLSNNYLVTISCGFCCCCCCCCFGGEGERNANIVLVLLWPIHC